jgi:hypothetical protein
MEVDERGREWKKKKEGRMEGRQLSTAEDGLLLLWRKKGWEGWLRKTR